MGVAMGTFLNATFDECTKKLFLYLKRIVFVRLNYILKCRIKKRPHCDKFYTICFFIPSTTRLHIINSIPKTILNLNKEIPI